MSKIIVTETLYKDGQTPLCFDCQKPAVAMQIKCNCGCNEIWCQPCYYKHYTTFAMSRSIQRFRDGDTDMSEKLSEAIANK